MKGLADPFEGSLPFSALQSQPQPQPIHHTQQEDQASTGVYARGGNLTGFSASQLQNLQSNLLMTTMVPAGTNRGNESVEMNMGGLSGEGSLTPGQRYDTNNQLYMNQQSGDLAAQLQQFQQFQQMQQIQQLQQLQYIQQIQQLQSQRAAEDSNINTTEVVNGESGEVDPQVFDLIQQQLQLQLQMDIQRQQQINNVITRVSSPLLKARTGPQVLKSIAKVKKNTPPKEYRCSHCQWIFNRHSDLTRHLKSHNAPEYHCPFWHPEYETCPHKNKGLFSRLDILKRHLKLVHFHQFQNSNDLDQRIRKRNGGECLSCGGVFVTMKDYIDHVGECALNTPMANWRYRKSGIVVKVSKEGDDLLDDDGTRAISSVNSAGTEEDNNLEEYYQGGGIKKRMDSGNKITYLDSEHVAIVKNVIPALKRPRGRPKKYTT